MFRVDYFSQNGFKLEDIGVLTDFLLDNDQEQEILHLLVCVVEGLRPLYSTRIRSMCTHNVWVEIQFDCSHAVYMARLADLTYNSGVRLSTKLSRIQNTINHYNAAMSVIRDSYGIFCESADRISAQAALIALTDLLRSANLYKEIIQLVQRYVPGEKGSYKQLLRKVQASF